MSDFGGMMSSSALPPPFLSTYSRYSGLYDLKQSVGTALTAASVTAATANQARYYPISIPFDYPVRRVWWINGSSTTGNRTFGIYRQNGERIYTTGATATTPASNMQYVDNADLWLTPGDYYFAFNCGTTTNGLWGIASTAAAQRFAGIQQQAVGADTLPDPATFATPTVAGVNLCGVTSTTTGF